MTKYKLTKEYPGSPKLGEIRWFESVDIHSPGWYSFTEYELWPDFWKKISLDAESGTQFTTRFSKIIYTIDSMTDNNVIVSWQVGNDTRTERIPLEKANENLANGSWTLI